jgi:putative transposase
MCSLLRNKFVIGSKRYHGFDYSSRGNISLPFVQKTEFTGLGKWKMGVMILSDLGKYLQNEWLKTPDIRPDMNIILDEFVIMPDHFHAIIIIGYNQYNQNGPGYRGNAMHGVSIEYNQYQNEFGPQLKNLSSIIRGIKSAVTTNAKKQRMDFQWLTRYHDHIIRSHNELQRIRKYIMENPQKWKNK